MVCPEEVEERVVILEDHVMSQVKDRPGLLMRMDRVELVAKIMLALAGMGVAWETLRIVAATLARHATP
jgi:hypothetical protein